MNWPWNQKPTPSKPPAAPPADPPIDVLHRLGELEARVSQLVLDWATTLEKINRWASRQVARERRRADRALDDLGEDHSDGSEIAEDGSGATNGAGVESGSAAERALRKAALRSSFQRQRGG